MPMATPLLPAPSPAAPPNGSSSTDARKPVPAADDQIQQPPRYTTTSYPSNCLRFLHDVPGLATAAHNPDPAPAAAAPVQQARVKLNILIVGAGLGGLATAIALRRRGHTVTVFEQAPELTEVGAGIQLPPNSAKLLARWGVLARLRAAQQLTTPDRIVLRRWADGAPIGATDTTRAFAARFGAPYGVAHRAHLHAALHAHATAAGVRTRLASRVAAYDAGAGRVVLAGGEGECCGADLVVAADGVRSAARAALGGGGAGGDPAPTGWAVYRATVDVEVVRRRCPGLRGLVERPSLNLWIGDQRHVMTYTIAGGRSFNMVLSHPDRGDDGDDMLGAMRREFEGWDEQLTTIISLVDKAIKTPLVSGAPLARWVAPSARLVLVGDAAHAMVPYMSQGAAMAVEDGAALAAALGRMTSAAQLPFALRVYARERRRRTAMMQEASLVNGMLWHFADGPLQRARDAAMRAEVEGRHFLASPNQWSDPVTQDWAYGYDAEAVIERAWDEAVGELIVKSEG